MKNTAITLPIYTALGALAAYFAEHPSGLPLWVPIVAAAVVTVTGSVTHLYQAVPGNSTGQAPPNG